jgi:hypothetical protein
MKPQAQRPTVAGNTAWRATSSLVTTLMPGVVGLGTKIANKILNIGDLVSKFLEGKWRF